MANTLLHRHISSVRTNAGTVTAADYTISGTAESNIELNSLAIGTNTAQDFTCDVSTCVSLAIEWTPASGSSSMTIKTNSSGSPADTLTILAGKPLMWDTQILATIGTVCPLTVDVTGLFLTTTAIGNLAIYALTNGS